MPDPNTPPPDSGEGGAAEAAGGTPPTPPEPKKLEFTQEELDRIIADRVARAKPKDYDELVALKAKSDEAEEAKKTELQKEKEARAEAERKAKERISAADAKLIRAELLTEATVQKAADPSIVVELLKDKLTVDDDGNVVGAKEAIKVLLKEKPLLAASSGSTSGGGEFGGNDPRTVQEKITELERAGKHKEARELKMSLVSIGQ